MGNAIIYTRVSTKNQAEEGYSLAGQEKDCKAFAEVNGYSVSKVFVEKGESAKTQARTELQNLMKFCVANKKNIDAIIIWKIDRLTRDIKGFYSLQDFFAKLNIKVLFARENNGDSATDKLTRNLMGVLAQYENDQKSERVTNGMKTAFLQGHWMWKAPIGYLMKNGNIEPDPKTAHHIKKIFKLFATGMYQQVQILEILKNDGFEINNNLLCLMLRNSLYMGYMYKKEWSKEPVRGVFEPLITEEIFRKVQRILDGNKPLITPHKRNNPLYPLRQFITCPNCNQPLTASQSRGRKERYAYYHCYNKDCCINFRIRKERLEDEFIKYLEIVKPDKRFLDLFKAVIADVHREMVSEQVGQIKALEKRLSEARENKNRLLDFYLSNKIRQEDYDFKSEDIDRNIKRLETMVADCKIPENDLIECVKYVTNMILKINEVYANSTLDIKQRLQRLIFPQGVSYDLERFRTPEISSLFIKKDASTASYSKMVLPGEFESPSTP